MHGAHIRRRPNSALSKWPDGSIRYFHPTKLNDDSSVEYNFAEATLVILSVYDVIKQKLRMSLFINYWMLVTK